MNKLLNKILTLLLILILLVLLLIFKPLLPKINTVVSVTPSPTNIIKEAGVSITLNKNQTPTLQHLSPDNEPNIIQLDPSQVTPVEIGTVSDDTIPKPPPPQILAEISMEPYGPGKVAANSKTGHVYIATGWEIAILTGTIEITRVTTGSEPRAIAVDSNNNRVYVANFYSNTVTIIQNTQILTNIAIAGRQLSDVTIDPKTGWAYVISPYEDTPPGEKQIVSGKVTVISGTQIIKVIPLGRVLAKYIAHDPISGYMYIGESGGDGEIVVIDGLIEIARFNVQSSVKAMDIDPQTGDVYVLSRSSDRHLTQFRDGEFIAKLYIEEEYEVRNMQVHPTTGDVYIVDFGGEQAIVVRDMKVIALVPLGWNPYKMTIDPLSGNVYVANFSDNTVTVINGTTVLTTIEVGIYPYGIGVNPTNGWVYVSNDLSNTITVLGYPE